MARKQPVPDVERAICARLKAFREEERRPRNVFAEKLGISPEKLASVENGLTPMRYNLAWRVASRFGLNLRWLATGKEPRRPAVSIPSPIDAKIPQSGLFSEVYRDLLAAHFEGASQFISTVNELRAQLDELCAGRAPAPAEDAPVSFVIARPEWLPAMRRAAELLRDYERVIARKAKEREEAIRESEHHHKTHPNEPRPVFVIEDVAGVEDVTQASSNFTVDTLPSSGSVSAVTMETLNWNAIVERLKKATAAPGTKARLARELGASRQSVHKWGSGAGAPSADVTLRLLGWILNEESKLASGGGTAAPPPKVRGSAATTTPARKGRGGKP